MTRITDSPGNSSDEEYNNEEALSEKFRKRAKKEIEGQRFLRKSHNLLRAYLTLTLI